MESGLSLVELVKAESAASVFTEFESSLDAIGIAA